MAALPNLRRGIGNRVTTSLSASVTDAALTMTVSDATGMNANGGYIMIDEEYSNKREIVYVESITSNTLTISTSGRGLAGTTAVSHDSGATVTDIVVDENVNGIIDTFEIGHTDAGAHVLPNNSGLSIKQSGGTAKNAIKMTSGDVLQIGEAGIDIDMPDASIDADFLNTGAGAQYIVTSQTTTSTSYTDLSTAGPAVTVTIGANGLCLIGLYGYLANDGANTSRMSFAASGANTIAADSAYAIENVGTSASKHGAVHLLTGLTPGSTVFTAKYSVSGGTGTFLNRRLFVVPL